MRRCRLMKAATSNRVRMAMSRGADAAVDAGADADAGMAASATSRRAKALFRHARGANSVSATIIISARAVKGVEAVVVAAVAAIGDAIHMIVRHLPVVMSRPLAM